jgi:hypothetical protein
MRDALYSGMKQSELVIIRMREEVTEHGTIGAALAAVERQIASPDSIALERAFMRKVRNALLNAGNQAFYAQGKV